jgi:recombination protein RecA
MAKKKAVDTNRDELTGLLADSLNKKFNKTHHKVAYFLDGGKDSPTDVNDWVSTGSTVLDLAISNRPNGGLPVSKIVEITGLEQSGKSLLASHVIANTQKKGGIAVYIDTESSLNTQFLQAIGVDTDKMLYLPLETVEDIFDAITDIITKVREKDANKLVTIVVDSVAAATTKIESAADFEKDGYATQKAIILSKAMRKITNLIGQEKILLVFTNQLRQKMGAMPFADQYTTSGGKALQFHSSVRLRLKQVGKLKEKINGVDEIVGSEVEAIVVKNRMGPPNRKVRYNVFYRQGMDDYGGWLKLMKNYSVCKQSGPICKYVDTETGEIVKFNGKDLEKLCNERPEVREAMYRDTCDTYIMKYQHEDSQDMDPDVEIDETGL